MRGDDESLDVASRKLKVLPTLARQGAPLSDPLRQLETIAGIPVEHAHGGDFDTHLKASGAFPLRATGLEVLQLNLGRLCNQTCVHCHVDAGPDRKEDMSPKTAEACMAALAKTDIPTVDITGGAPEMSKVFRHVVEESFALGRHIIDRCNLTILLAPRHSELPEFLAKHRVEIVCSLPHYRQFSTDRQRGEGVFEQSIEALRRLNALGYGREGSGLRLVLVTNPVGAFLPAGQDSLEGEWKREMKRLWDIEFNSLFTITNMPVSRYLEWLQSTGKLESYQQLLVDSFNPVAADSVMCRTMISVDWNGYLFDCDFNQMLELKLSAGLPQHISDFDFEALARREIVTREHCFGCTAGSGSSCGGSLSEE